MRYAGHAAIHQPVDIGQNLGHGAVQMSRNLLADLDRGVQGARQGRIFDDGNLVVQRPLADAQRQIVLPLGHYAWRRCRTGGNVHGISDRHRVVGGVDDDRGGMGNFLHHLLAGHVALDAPDAHLGLGIAFRLFGFLLDLLFAHLELLVVAAGLPHQVDDADQQKHRRRSPQQRFQHASHVPDRHRRVHPGKLQQHAHVLRDFVVNHQARDRNQAEGLEQHGQILAGKRRQSLERIKPLEVGR